MSFFRKVLKKLIFRTLEELLNILSFKTPRTISKCEICLNINLKAKQTSVVDGT